MTVKSNRLPHPAYGGTVSAMTYNPLVLPGKPEVRSVFPIAAGQQLPAGAVLGAITAAGATFGHLKLCAADATDGSQIPVAILPEDVDTTAGMGRHSCYVEGMFNETALTFGTGHSADSVRVSLSMVGIYLSVQRYSHI